MNACSSVQSRFSEYLDGAIPGAEMQRIAAHLETCPECATEFSEWREIQRLLAAVSPVKAPPDLGLRLRVAISQERKRTAIRRLDVWQMHWQNTVAPVLARGAAGLATAVVLFGVLALAIGTMAAPTPVAANETTASDTHGPNFLYSLPGADSGVAFHGPIMVEVAIDNAGKVYDYRILSGSQSPTVRKQLDNFLLMSHFTPALNDGVPVSGVAILSLSRASGDHG